MSIRSHGPYSPASAEWQNVVVLPSMHDEPAKVAKVEDMAALVRGRRYAPSVPIGGAGEAAGGGGDGGGGEGGGGILSSVHWREIIPPQQYTYVEPGWVTLWMDAGLCPFATPVQRGSRYPV